jgi:outer membrane protein OmpA-like peptidoglycan-associated protein
MDFDCPHLSLAPYWADEDDDRRIVLVRAVDALALCRRGGYEKVSSVRASWNFQRESHRLLWNLRGFAIDIGLGNPYEARYDDQELVALFGDRIQHGELVGLRKAEAMAAAEADPTIEQRQLVRAIESQTRGQLSEGGRRYKLVAGADVAGTPDRNSYEVVRHDEGRRVLAKLAGESSGRGELAELLEKARAKLSPDWRPPLPPKGLVLLRRIAAQRAKASSPAPVISPSQMRAMMESEKPLQFFARFVDERGKPVTGFTGDFEHADDPKCDMAFSGSDFARMGDLKGERKAWLKFADEANQDLVDELKKRWQQIRGEADEAWKEKEESLIEVLFKEGKLPELQLEAEKKHTFMLRPPVALARMHGMYFDTSKCFLLPTAARSLKRLPEIYLLHPDSEVLIVGHTDTAGSEAYNLDLSADRADAMKAYLRDDADVWLAWYEKGVRQEKRWGVYEDGLMIAAIVPHEILDGDSEVHAYQEWHNGEAPDARQPDQPRSRPVGWEELKADGIMGPKTRRQLILDYMNLDGTSLPNDTRVVTYGCGEYFPLAEKEGEVDEAAKSGGKDGEHVQFDRRVDVFFFAKPFGILPPVPGVADGASSSKATEAAKDDELYPEWRLRAARTYQIDTGDESPTVVVEWPEYLTDALPSDLAIQLVSAGLDQTIAWADGLVADDVRRFAFDADPSSAKYSLIAHAGGKDFRLWNEIFLDDPNQPPPWENLLSDLARPEDDDTEEAASDDTQPETGTPHAISDFD